MRRFALVIGIAGYPSAPLANAAFDARKAATALAARGFVTKLLEDTDALNIKESLTSLSSEASQADIALVYLAGHAVERSGIGYFLPMDFPFPVSALALKHYAVSLGDVVQAVRPARAGIVVLDACRNWPSSGQEEILLDEQLDAIAVAEREWQNVLLAYSTSSTAKASDGMPGQGSRFCNAFCRNVLDHSLSMDECFRRIVQEVVHHSPRRQQPWTYSSLERSLSFSDLPKFYAKLRHKVSNSGAWCVPDFDRRGILAGADDDSVWHVLPAKARRVRFIKREQFVGAATPNNHFVFATIAGDLFTNKSDLATKFGTKPSHGLAMSPNATHFTLYGKGLAIVLTIENDVFREIRRINTDFDIYCCTYISNDKMWLAGDKGTIVSVDLQKSAQPDKVAVLGTPINALVRSGDGKKIYCAGQSGLLAELETSGNSVRRILENRLPSTPAGIRGTLSDVALDEAIHAYLFERHTLPNQTITDLEERIKPISFFCCSHSAHLPIVAVGTSECTVLIIDTRDGQQVQEIEVAIGSLAHVIGLAFLSTDDLAVLSSDGTALFFSPRYC